MTLLFIKRLNDTFEENAEKLIQEGKSQKETYGNTTFTKYTSIVLFPMLFLLVSLIPQHPEIRKERKTRYKGRAEELQKLKKKVDDL